MDYVENLKKSFELWWEHKYLWFLGMIVAFFSAGSSFNSNINSSGSSDNSEFPLMAEEFFDMIIEFVRSIPIGVWILIMVVIVVGTIVWMTLYIYLSSMAKSALIKSSNEVYDGKYLGFKKSWSLGKPYWYKLFMQKFVLSLPIYFLLGGFLLIFLTALMSAGVNGINNLTDMTGLLAIFSSMFMLFLCLICVISIYAIFISVISPFAERKLILEDYPIIKSISAGWNYLVSNFAEVFVSWLLLFGVSIAIGFALMFVMMILMMIILLIGGGMAYVAYLLSPILAVAVGLIFLTLLVIVMTIIQGPLVTWGVIYWTVAYRKIDDFKKLTLPNGGKHQIN